MTFDLRQAQRLVDSIPEVKESIPYLTQLAEGSNPEIPGYLALGKLMQISALANSAQPNKPPQGTIKDKLTQSSGIMALMGGRGQEAAQNSQMAQMNQPGPAPQGIPQPEMQSDVPDEMMGMADGGITSAEIDPRMFNFDGGGIVAFANPEKEKKQQVKDKDEDRRTTALGDALRALIEPITSGVQATADYGRVRNERDAARPGLLEALTPEEREQRLAQTASLNRELSRIGGGDNLPPVSPQQNAEALRETQRLAANATARQQPVIMSENPDLVPGVPPKPEAPPAPPKPPMGGINDGKTPVPGANIPAIGAGKPQALPENEFLGMSKQFIQEKPEEFNEAQEAAKIKARNEAAGIGTYAKVMREQQQAMRDKFAASQPDQFEKLLGLGRAYSRVGARSGDVGAEGAAQMRAEREAAFQFEQDQFKVTEAIEKLEEARRTGDVQAIAKAESDLKKANADKKNHQMTAAASAANTLGKAQEGALDRAQQLQIENAKLQVKKAELAQASKDSDIARVMKEVEALEKAGLVEEANKKLDLWGKANALKMGARYEGKDNKPTPTQINDAIEKAYKTRNQMDFMTLANKNAKPADVARAQANIERTKQDVLRTLSATGGGGGGGGGQPISEAEYRALPKGATYIAPDGSQRVKG